MRYYESYECIFEGSHLKISVGQVFNRLTIIRIYNHTNKKYADCECECGKIVYKVRVRNLLSGSTKSCGCYNSDIVKERNFKHGHSQRGKRERLYYCWLGMRRRCNTESDVRYESYGGRGITVCNEWDDYKNFKNWALQNGYKDNLRKNGCQYGV